MCAHEASLLSASLASAALQPPYLHETRSGLAVFYYFFKFNFFSTLGSIDLED